MSRLLIISASKDAASKLYVTKKIQKGKELGHEVLHVDCIAGHHLFGSTITESKSPEELYNRVKYVIQHTNNAPLIHGTLLQLPLDDSIKEYERGLIELIDPKKDVDCLTSQRQGNIMLGNNDYLPCTTQAVLDSIRANCPRGIKGQSIHVVGRSVLVTKPLIMALINEGASVRTWNSAFCKSDIEYDVSEENYLDTVHFVSGIGVSEYFDFSDKVLSNTHIYDIGINRDEEGKLCGDVKRDLDCASQTPVPGGIGPQTVLNVFKNLEKLEREQRCEE